MAKGEVEVWDLVVIVLYFILILATGIFAMFRSNRGTVSGYFLAGRFMTWLPVGASLFASNIGSEHFIGLAGSGAASGIGVGAFELNALIILQLLGWVFLPVYIASGVSTLPEFMSKRFGGWRIRVYLALLSLILYVFTKISVNIYSGALFVQIALGWNIYFAILLVLTMTAICTITGGLTAVIYTDTMQCALMLIGGTSLSILAFIWVGGYTSLVEEYMFAIPNSTLLNKGSTCGLPNKESFTMLRGPSDPDFPWPGFLLGQSPASIWYWAADQMMVQRTLAAKSLSHAQGATLFAGYLKIMPFFIMVLPGMISRVMHKDTVGCITNCEEVCGNPVSCSNLAYPELVLSLMPTGAKGAMLAVMIAALVSDLTSIFNSASTLFTIDIWAQIREKASTREILLVGRLWILVMVAISIVWVPVVQQQQGGQLFIYIQSVSADLSPPIAAVYLLAILWKRTNEKGAFWGLAVGFVIGVIRMVLEFIFPGPQCGEPDLRPLIMANVHYMYFALFLFWVTVAVTVIVSLCTPPPEPRQLIRTTYWTRKDKVSVDDISTKEDEQINQPAESHAERSLPKKAWDWFCGFQNTQKLSQTKEQMQKLTSLEQSVWEKRILNLNLAVILTVAVFLYTFFSAVSPIQTGEF